jgi:hypothetical protein
MSIMSSTDAGASGRSRLDSSGGIARAWLVAASLAVAAQAPAQLPAARPAGAAGQPRLSVGYGNLPLSFEANQGQSEEPVKFLARGPGYSLFLTHTDAVLSLRAPALQKPSAAGHAATATRDNPDEPAKRAAVVHMRFVGANTRPQLTGLEPQPGKCNYFIGDDPERWQRDVPNYARVRYAGVYPGIDVIYYGNQRQLEYDIVGDDWRVWDRRLRRQDPRCRGGAGEHHCHGDVTDKRDDQLDGQRRRRVLRTAPNRRDRTSVLCYDHGHELCRHLRGAKHRLPLPSASGRSRLRHLDRLQRS